MGGHRATSPSACYRDDRLRYQPEARDNAVSSLGALELDQATAIPRH